MRLLGHSGRCGQVKRHATYLNEEDRPEEFGDCSCEEQTMCRTDGDEFSVREIIEEKKHQLNDEKINTLIQTKIKECVHNIEQIENISTKFESNVIERLLILVLITTLLVIF